MKKIFCILLFCGPFFICAQNNKPTLVPLFNQKDTSVFTQHDTDRFVVFHFEEVRHIYDSIPIEIDVALRAIHYMPTASVFKKALMQSVAYDTTTHTTIHGDWWKFQFEKRTIPISLEYYGDTIYIQSMYDTELAPELVDFFWQILLCTGLYMLCVFSLIVLFGAQRNNGDITGHKHLFLSAFMSAAILIAFAFTNIVPYMELPHMLFPAIGGLIAFIAGMLFWQKKLKKVN